MSTMASLWMSSSFGGWTRPMTGPSRPRDPSAEAALRLFGLWIFVSSLTFPYLPLHLQPTLVLSLAQPFPLSTADPSNKPFPWGMQALFFNPEVNVPAGDAE